MVLWLAEYWRIDAFEKWCWRRLLTVPWTARSNQSIWKEINPDCSLEGLMMKLKLQSFGHLIWKATWYEEPTHWKRPLCWERLRAGERDNRGWDGWKASPTQWTWVWAKSGSWWRKRVMLWSTGSQRVGHDRTTEQHGTWHMANVNKYLMSGWTSCKVCNSVKLRLQHQIHGHDFMEQMKLFQPLPSSLPAPVYSYQGLLSSLQTACLHVVWSLDQQHQYHLGIC